MDDPTDEAPDSRSLSVPRSISCELGEAPVDGMPVLR